MKALKIMLFLLFAGILIRGNAQQKPASVEIIKDSVAVEVADSTTYEILVFDVGFENWLATNSRPKWYYENDFYRTKNHQYTVTWNNLVRQAMYRPPFEYEIEFDPKVDYGLDVNWKLYWYYKYLEHTLGITLN